MAGLLQSLLDAIHGEDDQIGGRTVTQLTSLLTAAETAEMLVDSTIGFGEWEDGADDALLLIGGELIYAAGRTDVAPFKFTTLTRAMELTEAKLHPAGTLVRDYSGNRTALDHLKRGFLVRWAVGEDLTILGNNLGLHRCPGVTEDQYRAFIQAVAYGPKNPIQLYKDAMTALTGGTSTWRVYERAASDPWKVFVEVEIALSTDIRGRFFINGGEPALTTGANTVDVDYTVNHVIGVYADTISARRGRRDGLTNFFNPGGSFVGNTITMGTSPGGGGTPVIVDYGAFSAHYLAENETVRQDINQADRWAYLADPLAKYRCMLNQIRTAGVKVVVTMRV